MITTKGLTLIGIHDSNVLMKTKFILILCVSLAFAATTFAAGADEKAVRDADEAWSMAAAAKEVDKTVAFYSDDAVVMPPNTERVTTKEAIRKIWKDLLTDAKLSWKASKVEVAKSGDIAFISGTYEVTMNDVVTGKPVNDHGKYLEVWEKQTDGSWKCGADIWNSDVPLIKAAEKK